MALQVAARGYVSKPDVFIWRCVPSSYRETSPSRPGHLWLDLYRLPGDLSLANLEG